MKKALIYVRVSSDRQRIEGNGLESQLHRCEKFAEYQGYSVEEHFVDSFTGGGDFMNRPAMKSLLAYVDQRPYESYVVIFDDLKRFARDTIFHWNLREAFRVRNLQPLCLNYNFDDSPAGHFIETIHAAHNQLEREENKRQVIDKQKARLEKGYWAFGSIRGYKQTMTVEHGTLLVPDENAHIIKEALEGFANGRFLTQREVGKFLALKLGLKYLGPNAVKKILTRVIYAGYIEYPDWEVERRLGHHKPLISLDTYNRIQRLFREKGPKRRNQNIRKDFPLRGDVKCGHCKKYMTASWTTGKMKKQYAFYRCNNKDCHYSSKSIRKADIEGAYENLLKSIEASDKAKQLVKAVCEDVWKKREKEILVAHKRLRSSLDGKTEKIELYLERAVSSDSSELTKVYEEKAKVLISQRDAIKSKLESKLFTDVSFETSLETVLSYLKSPYFQWSNGDLETQKLVTRLAFGNSLEYDRENGFETLIKSLPIRLFELSEGPKQQLVDIEPESWNQLKHWLIESHERIKSYYGPENSHAFQRILSVE